MLPHHPSLQQISQVAKTKAFGKNACLFDHCDSTNSQAMDLARKGAGEGTLVLAERQEAGRGRLGRRWFGAERQSLLFTLVLRPPLPSVAASQVTLLLAVGVAKALRRSTGLPAEIKWPNDVLINGRKVCGILVEMQGQVDRVDFLAAGLGINVGQAREDFPEELRHLATSLALEKGEPLERLGVLAAVLEECEALYLTFLRDGFSVVLSAWEGLSCMAGRQVRAQASGGRIIEGMVSGLDPDGALRVRLDNGVQERLVAGDVTLL